MNPNDFIELYEEVKDDIKFFITSDVRARILISLKEGSKNLSRLRTELHLSSSSTILHAMNQLEERELIFRESGNYSLSQIGEIAANKLIELMKAIYSLNRCRDLLLDHEISCIPQHLLKDIGCLNNSHIIKSQSTDITKPFTSLDDFLSDAKKIKHVSSIFFPQIVEFLISTLDGEVDVEIIVTGKVLDKFMEIVNLEKLKKLTSEKNLKLWQMDNDIKLSFTIADKSIALGLFSTGGGYDLNTLLISEGDEALSWGSRLFNHYLKQSRKIKL